MDLELRAVERGFPELFGDEKLPLLLLRPTQSLIRNERRIRQDELKLLNGFQLISKGFICKDRKATGRHSDFIAFFSPCFQFIS